MRAALAINLALWVAWFAYWAIAARNAKPMRWREPLSRFWAHNALALLGAVVFTVPRLSPAFLQARFLPLLAPIAILGTLLTALGLGIAIAARVQLAGNWSAAVEIKEHHTLIRSGLYARVRHPIYSGLLLALLGSAIAIGRWRTLLGVGLLLVALVLKARHEEAGLCQAFPDYAAYIRETSALIPFLL